jgi:hypothetical protein
MALVTDSIQFLKGLADATVKPLGLPTYIGNPAGQGDLPNAYCAVAYGGDDRPGVTGARDARLAYGNNTVGDQWFVWVTISVASGDVDPVGLLSDVEDAMDAFDDALRANRTMGGLLLADGRAEMLTHEWAVEDAGNVATVFFLIDIQRRW